MKPSKTSCKKCKQVKHFHNFNVVPYCEFICLFTYSVTSHVTQVAWLRGSENRFFEYIRDRDPPYRNFSFLGADIDVSIQSIVGGLNMPHTNLNFISGLHEFLCESSSFLLPLIFLRTKNKLPVPEALLRII